MNERVRIIVPKSAILPATDWSVKNNIVLIQNRSRMAVAFPLLSTEIQLRIDDDENVDVMVARSFYEKHLKGHGWKADD